MIASIRTDQKSYNVDLSKPLDLSIPLREGENNVNAFYIPPVKFDFWYNRAAFHFLTSEEQINKYVSIAEEAVNPDGYLILGTFSESGPKKCSGLEIKQYNEASMSSRFEKAFERIKCIEEDHVTPFNTIQHFLFCSFRKK